MMMFDQSLLLADVSPMVQMAENSAIEQSSASARRHVVGQCLLVQTSHLDGFRTLNPIMVLISFYEANYKKDIDWRSAIVTIVKSPEHGDVSLKIAHGLLKEKQAYYTPTQGYTGTDMLVLRVTGADYGLEIHYFLRVIVGDPDHPNVPDSEVLKNPDCKGLSWTIAAASSPQQPHMFSGDAQTNYLLKDVSISVSILNLASGVVDEIASRNITPDYDGDSFDWLVDPRPH